MNILIITVAGIAINGFSFSIFLKGWLWPHTKCHTHIDPHISCDNPKCCWVSALSGLSLVYQNAINGKVPKLLKLEPLEVEKCYIPQMKDFLPKIKMSYVTEVRNSLRSKYWWICAKFWYDKLSPSLILLRVETGL